MRSETIGELNIAVANLTEKLEDHIASSKDSHEKIMESIRELTRTCDLTLQQALKTNGRVNIIEPLALDYQEQRARLKGSVMTIGLFGVAVVSLLAFFGNLYINHKTIEISEAVYKKLETNYNIEITP